jgi:hypothetical protein
MGICRADAADQTSGSTAGFDGFLKAFNPVSDVLERRVRRYRQDVAMTKLEEMLSTRLSRSKVIDLNGIESGLGTASIHQHCRDFLLGYVPKDLRMIGARYQNKSICLSPKQSTHSFPFAFRLFLGIREDYLIVAAGREFFDPAQNPREKTDGNIRHHQANYTRAPSAKTGS